MMDAKEYDEALIEALWAQLHSTHTSCEDVLQGTPQRIDKGSMQG